MSDDESTDHYQGALLEALRDDIERFAEAMADVPGDVRQLKVDVSQLKSDMVVVKAAVTDVSGQHSKLAGRVTKLEDAS